MKDTSAEGVTANEEPVFQASDTGSDSAAHDDPQHQIGPDESALQVRSDMDDFTPTAPPPPFLVPTDVGQFQDLQASSPSTGKLVFNFGNIPSRRQSLNYYFPTRTNLLAPAFMI